MSVVVYETDIGTYLKKNAGLKNIEFKTGDNTVTVTLGDVSALKGNNKVLLQQVQDKAWPTILKSLPGLVTELKKADDKDEAKRDKACDKALQNFMDEIGEDVIGLCQKVFTDFAKDRKDYKVYKVKKGIKIGVSGASLAGSLALTGLSGWTGVGTVVGVIGAVRATASLGQQIANLAVDSEKIYERLVANIERLKKQLASPSVKENTGKQIATAVLNKVFAVEIETMLVTGEGIEGDFKLLKSKLAGNKTNVVAMANEIPKLMKQQDAVAADIKKLEDIVTGTRSEKEEGRLAKLKAEEKGLEARLDKILKDVTKLSEKINKIDAWAATYSAQIAALNSKYSGKATGNAAIAAQFVIAATSFVVGDFSSPANTLADLHDASKRVAASLAIVNDSYDVLGTIGEKIYGEIKKKNG